MAEKDVVQQVKAVILVTGLKIQRINTGCFTVGSGANKRFIKTAEKGTLDFEGYDNRGRFVGIECKREKGGKVSPEQQARIDDINAKGGVAGIVRSGQEAFDLLKSNGCFEFGKQAECLKK